MDRILFLESNCGYFSDPWKNDSKEFVQYYTTEPFVHFTPTGGGKIGDMVFRIKVIDNHSFESEEIEIPLHIYENPDSCSGIPYICGDVNDDQSANVSDAVRIINFIFSGGAPPYPFIAGDVNCDYKVNISDAVWLINYVFAGGYAPCDTDGDGNPDCHDYL